VAILEEPDVCMERGQAACQRIARPAQLLQGAGAPTVICPAPAPAACCVPGPGKQNSQP